MKNTTGRDNAMYYISDNNNLQRDDDNPFDALMSLNNIQPGAPATAMSQQLGHMNSMVMS